MKTRVLIADDEKDICKALEFVLKREGYDVVTVNSGEEAVERFKKEAFDVVLTDLKMGKLDGIGVLQQVHEISSDTPVIIMTAFASVESAVDAMKQGAVDYIVKPFHNEIIKLTIKKVLEQKRILLENKALKHQLNAQKSCPEFITQSAKMQEILQTITKVIPTKSSVLILGESGVGKGQLAEMIHCKSPRKDKAFISINCSAIPETLLESELFGYKKGAFTGAAADKEGLIVMANQGTLFLDEIGDMPVNLQAKILKVIETGEVYPLGDTKPKLVDIRLISATNVDIDKRIKEGKFREDLYWRLNVIEVTIPPLRERKEDIELLSRHFLHKFSLRHEKEVTNIDKDALTALLNYHWPGNVRELSNTIERAIVLAETDTLTCTLLPQKILKGQSVGCPEGSTLKSYLGDYEKNLLTQIYTANNKNKEATAKALGIDLATLYRKLKKYGIDD